MIWLLKYRINKKVTLKVSASSQSLIFILSLRLYSSVITSGPGSELYTFQLTTVSHPAAENAWSGRFCKK